MYTLWEVCCGEDGRSIFWRKEERKGFISVSKGMRREKYGLSRLVLIRREERSILDLPSLTIHFRVSRNFESRVADGIADFNPLLTRLSREYHYEL